MNKNITAPAQTLQDIFGDCIYSYTRKQAIDDGILIDVTATAREAGFRFNTCITSALHNIISDIPSKYDYQDYNGRLWDVLYMASMAARRSNNTNTILFQVIMNIKGTNKKYQTFKAVISGDDNGEPCITIMMPNED